MFLLLRRYSQVPQPLAYCLTTATCCVLNNISYAPLILPCVLLLSQLDCVLQPSQQQVVMLFVAAHGHGRPIAFAVLPCHDSLCREKITRLMDPPPRKSTEGYSLSYLRTKCQDRGAASSARVALCTYGRCKVKEVVTGTK